VAICPMRIGVGIQNKALEAMAMGRPVIASPIAGRAIREAVATGGLTIADGVEGLTAACLERLTADPQDNRKAGEAARAYVEEHHRWEVATERFVRLYGEALAERVLSP
jgi:polysaccharide biosynthesis protein PslH